MSSRTIRARVRLSLAALLACGFILGVASSPAMAACANPVACENQLPGTPPSNWEVDGGGDPTIQGFATQMSVNVGQTISFKINTPSTAYHIDILRMGYYQGNGARLIASNIKLSTSLPQTQPPCLTDSSTGLIDCGNWAVSASWAVPSTAVSGIYIAHLVRDDSKDPGGDSQIIFVVRNDSSHSDILVATSDATWEAYNDYGGNSLYTCTVACPPGNPLAYKAAYAVSYNRPFDGAYTTDGGASYFYYAEYQMDRWLEENGYDVSYTDDGTVDSQGALLLNHKIFMSSGHDEYWSAGERANVTNARDHGVNLAFFSGNEVFWKTRWAASSDGSNTPYRTLISYKETHFNAPTDPKDPTTWTGTWEDPRFSPPADGGNPSNSLTGQLFVVNSGTADIKVPSLYSKLRLWRNTAVAKLSAGQTTTLDAGGGTLGYEWDVDVDNGFRPAGQIDMSSTTVANTESFTDYGSTVAENVPQTHHLTLYRAPSGALVFGAGTVQWSWGLDNTNGNNGFSTDPSGNPPDPTMEQATVNLFADMGVQPTSLLAGLTPATKSTDTTPPTSSITSPTGGTNFNDGTATTISGTATDAGGGVVAGVEVSTDGGTTWHPATLTTAAAQSVTWSYSWTAQGNPSTKIMSRATDDSGNIEKPSAGVSVNVSCPCSVWGSGTPGGAPDSADGNAVSVGMKFSSDAYGTINALRFYKVAANTGAHVGSLWTASGTLLAQATFANETASGWQQATLSSPVTITPHTTYVVSYYAPNGHYAASLDYFYPGTAPTPLGGGKIDNPPLHALSQAASGGNGLFTYGANTFPTSSYQASNYWVDVVFASLPVPGPATNVTATAGKSQAAVTWTAPTTGGAVTTYTITPFIGSTAQTPTTVTGTPPLTSATVPNLTAGTSYTFKVTASNPNGSAPASSPSNSVTPTAATAPSAPSGVTASPATSQALLTWTAPTDNGGSAISGYAVTPFIGSAAQTPVQVSGATTTSTTVTGLTNGSTYTFQVTATNGIGTSVASTPSSAITPEDTIFAFPTPSVVDSGDGNGVNLGVKFTADAAGTITGVRFYKAATNGGTHVGALWDASGHLLASATFTAESASGWQSVTFPSPVAINAGTTYVVSYYAPQGHYSLTSQGLSSAIDNAPLHALASGTSGNGVYLYGAGNGFPNGSYNASNYYVDPMFQPWTAPGPASAVTATAGKGTATLSWTAPSSGGPVTKYTITPYIGSTAQTTTTVTGSPPATTATITGLTGGTSYTFTVTAANPNASAAASSPSNAVTPTATTAPAAPGNVSANPASSEAVVNWSAPTDNGGSPITGYTITPYLGSAAQTTSQVSGASTTSATVTGLNNGQAYTFTVKATNAIGTSAESTASSAVTPEDTIFDFATPTVTDAGPDNPVTLGVKFTANAPGAITGVRFYKSAANTGTHVGALWDASGHLLASASFANETASGWQQVSFANPVAIVPNTTYVVSYSAPTGHYSLTSNGLATAVTNGPLTAVANGTSSNGVFGYGASSTFPNTSYNASNYYVDAMFQPNSSAGLPGAPSGAGAAPASSEAQVSWSVPSTDGGTPITGYTITPYIGATAQTAIQVSGSTTTSKLVTGLTNGSAYTFTVAATNAVGTGPASAASSAVTPADTLFDFATPGTIDSGDGSAVTLGVKFSSSASGSVAGIRFYKATSNTGTHVGALYDANGNVLAQATFANESTTGWQQVTFATPVPITAGTTYVAAYFAPNGHYSVDANALSSASTNGPLSTIANSSSSNGVFSYGGSLTYPNGTYNAANYWVDVLFLP
jgi:hypothetical protein